MSDQGKVVSTERSAQRAFNRRAIATMIAGFALLLFSFIVAIFAFGANQRSDEWVEHTYQVTQQLADLQVLIERTETVSRGFLLAPGEQRARTYHENRAMVFPTLDRIARLTADNPIQQRNVAEMRRRLAAEFESSDLVMDVAMNGALPEARELFSAAANLRRVTGIREKAEDIRREELRKLGQRKARERQTTRLVEVVLGFVSLLIVALALGSMTLVRRFVLDLTRSRDELNRLNSDLEGAVAERTADLTRANQEIQRFAYIVSHDLRSPLVNVMGFTAELDGANAEIQRFVEKVSTEQPELVGNSVRDAALEDLPEAIGFIRSSTQKMDRLINAILTLSRQGRRVLAPERLEMSQVVREIAASLATLCEARDAHIRIEGSLPDIVQDRLAVDQIFSNLMENATKYLKPGRPGEIVVRGTGGGARARFEIQDNGRGISPNDHERIFELFRRSGTQDQVGEGIGLAHVRALAYRLGGTVMVQSVLDEGSTFIVDLPLTAIAERDAK